MRDSSWSETRESLNKAISWRNQGLVKTLESSQLAQIAIRSREITDADPTLRRAGLFTLRKKLACSCYPSETREIRSERDMEQEIEFSNHENNWFISERIFWEEDARVRRFLDCFTEKLCCVKTARSREIPRWRYFWDWWLKYAYQTIYFCFFVPVKGNREGNSQFEEKESSFSPKNHRDWSTEKMRKPLKKLNKRNFTDDSVKKPRFWSDLWNSVISDR